MRPRSDILALALVGLLTGGSCGMLTAVLLPKFIDVSACLSLHEAAFLLGVPPHWPEGE